MTTPRERLWFTMACLAVIAGIVWVAGCAPPEGGYDPRLQSVTSYQVHPTRTTPGGVQIDDPLGEVSDSVLDGLTDRVEACLERLAEPTVDESAAMGCLPQRALQRRLERSWFAVKVAPDWYRSSCHPEQQLFPCRVDPSLCDAAHLTEKGLEPCPGAACACRATVQDNRVVVTAPFLLVYAGELLRLVTACNAPWSGPLAACANTYPEPGYQGEVTR